MKPINVALLMNHKSGVSDNYWRPTEKEVLQDYLKVVNLLTINDRQATLQKQFTKLTEKNEEQIYIIKGKLAKKEKEAEETKKKLEETRKSLADFENRQTLFEEKILGNLEKYQKSVLEMVGPYLEQKVKDKRELNREKIKALIQAPSAFGLINEEYLGETEEVEEEAHEQTTKIL